MFQLEPGDAGEYSCTAANRLGARSLQARLAVLEPPPPPSALHATRVRSRAVELSWAAGGEHAR